MRTIEEARNAALAHLATGAWSRTGAVLLESKTEEFSAGWVFYYQSAQYLATGNLQDALLGNAPLFVPRNDAPPSFISYHRPTSESMEAFVYCGNPNAVPNPEVELSGWKEGALKVSATQAIRECSSMGLAAAKEAVDLCLSGNPARVRTASVASARELVLKLEHLHFAARVTNGG